MSKSPSSSFQRGYASVLASRLGGDGIAVEGFLSRPVTDWLQR